MLELPSLALQHEFTAYDAAYLEVALRLGLPMATRDKALKRAMANSGVDFVEPLTAYALVGFAFAAASFGSRHCRYPPPATRVCLFTAPKISCAAFRMPASIAIIAAAVLISAS